MTFTLEHLEFYLLILMRVSGFIMTAPFFSYSSVPMRIRAAHAGHLLPIMVPDLLPANEEMQEKAEVVLPDLFEVIAYLKGEGAC